MSKSINHIPSLKESVRGDLSASIVVFLVALPLCLGIALASGAPLTGGLITGIIGGILVSVLSSSPLSVSGPAAGLAVISAESITQLGSYEKFLVAVFLAGILQILFGYLRLGIIGEYVPNAVVKGMLAGIGIVIILKQLPHALGEDKDFEGNQSFLQQTHDNTFTSILSAVNSANTLAVIIALTSIAILFGYDKLAHKFSRLKAFLPAPLLVVVFGSTAAYLVPEIYPGLSLSRESGHFVTLPNLLSAGSFLNLPLPDWSAFNHSALLKIVLTLAVIGSLESLLSLEATDKMDPYRRISSPNRELRAQGIGNMVVGLLGGLPMTAVIVRSSANIYAGATTWLSAFFHGVLLLAAILFIPGILEYIPLCALAAILIHVGYKLGSVKLFKEIYNVGPDQFIPFVATVVAIVFTDLLMGVFIGLTIGLFYVLKLNHHNSVTMVHEGEDYLLRFNKDVSFLNKMELKEALSKIPDGATVVVDGTKSMFIDRDIMDVLVDFQKNCCHRSVSISLRNTDDKVIPLSAGRKIRLKSSSNAPGLGV